MVVEQGHEVAIVDIGAFLAADATGRGPGPGQLPEGAREVARQWRAAFSAQGFASVSGHRVPDGVIERAYEASRRFFAQPMEAKRRCDQGLGYGPVGFTAQGVERVSASASRPDGSRMLEARAARPPDLVESMVIHRTPGDMMPADLSGYREAMYDYHDELTRLLRSIMRLTACSLDLPLDYFDDHFFGDGGVGPHSCIGECSLRAAYYPAFEDGAEPEKGQLRYGEHTDYTGFTILWQDHNKTGPQTAVEGLDPPPGGLQVLMADGSWADCPPEPRAFTVNAGDLIQVWTNDVFLSNTHRVQNPPPEDRSDRISLVFFTGPSKDTLIEALPTCTGQERPTRYAPITSGDHLQRKLSASNK